MNAFSTVGVTEINKGLELLQNDLTAMLVDVRTEEEFQSGHIPGSVNIPLRLLGSILEVVPAKDTPLFVYCQTGARSARAAYALERFGYKAVCNLGGICDYSGVIEQ